MAKKEKKPLVITSKQQMYEVAQRFLANDHTKKLLEKEMDEQKAALKTAREKFKMPFGPAAELDGPNGGITFSQTDQETWSCDAIEKYLGEQTYIDCTEISVKTKSKEHLKALIKQMVEDGDMTEAQAAEIWSKTGEVIKIIPVTSRKTK